MRLPLRRTLVRPDILWSFYRLEDLQSTHTRILVLPPVSTVLPPDATVLRSVHAALSIFRIVLPFVAAALSFFGKVLSSVGTVLLPDATVLTDGKTVHTIRFTSDITCKFEEIIETLSFYTIQNNIRMTT